MVLHDLPRAGIALEYAHAAFAPTTDQAAERLLWHEVNSTLPRRFDGEQLLRPGPEVAAAVAGMVDDLIATFRRRAAMQGTRGLADPEGVKRRLLDRLLGMGYLAPFLQNPEYEEIIVNGPRLYVIGGGHKRLIEHIVPEPDETLHLIKRAIGPLGARLDESSPVVELGLPDGSRLTAVIPPMTDQIKLTIRKFVLRAQRLETLVALGTLPQDAASFLEAAVRAYVNILVTGPTGAGKTTLLNVLGAAIASDQERVVTLEDTPELTLHKTLPDCVPLYGRASNVEGAGAITYRKLMRTALRLRPTYLIVGEVRGAEALDMLVAMATGHASLGSLHAESPRGALEQLATFAQMAEEHPSREALAQTIAAHVQLVVQVRIEPETGKRRVVHIFEVTGPGEGAVIEGQDLWTLDAAGQLVWTGLRPRCLARIHGRGIAYDLPPVPLGRARGDHPSQDGRGGRP